jgi:hypothetical protein
MLYVEQTYEAVDSFDNTVGMYSHEIILNDAAGVLCTYWYMN